MRFDREGNSIMCDSTEKFRSIVHTSLKIQY